MMKKTIISMLLATTHALPAEDKVDSLPEMQKFDEWGMYSGFIPLAGTTKTIHYVFLESQGDSAKDPLVIWFNGGPGCSSMLGFAQEHGPYNLKDGDKTFTKSDYSWNREANMLYIEQPAGVGYSYCDKVNAPQDCVFNDDTDAADNLAAVLGWYQKYPEYQGHELYISGESYAGIYVPYLVNQIHEHNQLYKDSDDFKPNLKGMMVGNGVTNWKYDTIPAFIEMGYWHSLNS